jgi:putative ABC transport system permease protein
MMGMRVLCGRGITRDDVERKEPVVVLGESLATTIFGDQDPIGRRIASNEPTRGGKPAVRKWLSVVGVVSDVPIRALNEPRRPPLLYTPLSLARGADTPITAMIGPSAATLSYAIRTSASPLDAMPAVRNLMRGIDDRVALAQVMTVQQTIDRASAPMTFTMALLAIAAFGALALGIVGIYGVTSYIVTQRTNEIGVRLALGAEPGRVAAQIVRQGGAVALTGIVLGLGAAFAGGRLIASVLYGVSPRDPVIFGAMAMLLLLVALLACWIPARRAAQLSPTIALRAE